MIIQGRSKRQASGKRYIKYRKKKLYEEGRRPTETRLGKTKIKKDRVRGGNIKLRALTIDEANIYDPNTKTYKKVKILTVKDNKANKQYVRRNVITKGAIIETEIGKAVVTSRPGQEGIVNGRLIQEE